MATGTVNPQEMRTVHTSVLWLGRRVAAAEGTSASGEVGGRMEVVQIQDATTCIPHEEDVQES